MWQPLEVSAYVLAGGRSSRMGQDKALLRLAGKPLVEHAVTKLTRICQDVAILSNHSELARFAPLVEDRHPDCGPMSGIEAALTHARHDWSLIVPVDLPFPPTSFLYGWMKMTLGWAERHGTRVAMFRVDEVPQPTLLMVHRDVAAHLQAAIEQRKYKLFPVLQAAARELAGAVGLDLPSAQTPGPMDQGMSVFAWTAESRFSCGESSTPGPVWAKTTPAQEAATQLYFMNLNTPAEFAEAERHVDVLDT